MTSLDWIFDRVQEQQEQDAAERHVADPSRHIPNAAWVHGNFAPCCRFWCKVDVRAPAECWDWQGQATGSGYGRIKWGGRLESAHRVAYELTFGPIPDDHAGYHGTVIRHSCDNRLCCNPRHLLAGSQADNVRDMVERGRV